LAAAENACACARTRAGTPETKKPQSKNSEALRLVRLAGIEPTTPWFVAKYSIQLSYSREARNYIDNFPHTDRKFVSF
jgi:hypothetical protein